MAFVSGGRRRGPFIVLFLALHAMGSCDENEPRGWDAGSLRDGAIVADGPDAALDSSPEPGDGAVEAGDLPIAVEAGDLPIAVEAGDLPTADGSIAADGGGAASLRVPWAGLGSRRACRVKADGSGDCWGENRVGGAEVRPGRYLQIFPLDQDTSISLTAEGKIVYFGGRLTGVPPFQPVDDRLVFLAPSAGMSCALRPDRTASCWGRSGARPTPAGAFVDLAVSDSVACGLREDGSATCWPGWDAPARDFPGPFSQVRGSQAAFCAIRADGTLSCWAGFRPPTTVQAAPPGRHTRLDMDARKACSLTADGVLVCWHLDASREPRAPLAGRFKDFVFREGQGCAEADDGRRSCWGSDEHGEGTFPDSDDLQAIGGDCLLDRSGHIRCWRPDLEVRPPYPTAAGFTEVDGSNFQGCALDAAGIPTCWSMFINLPVQPSSGAMSNVRATNSSMCALRRDSREVTCWRPVGVTPPETPPPGAFVALEVNGGAWCGIRADQTLACWATPALSGLPGAGPPPGTFKQVGVGPVAACAVRMDDEIVCWGQAAHLVPPTGPWKQVAVGRDYAVGLRPDGALVAFGRSQPPIPSGRFRLIRRGADCALTETGALRCWGDVWR